jgi:hypothetical protein
VQNGDRNDQNTDRVVEYVVGKAIAGHFVFIRLVVDASDGKMPETAEEQLTFETDGVAAILEPGESLAGASLWADEVRNRMRHTAPWHYDVALDGRRLTARK